MDDTGFPPDEVRSFILRAEGEWHLLIEESQLNKVAAMKILRQALGISLTETQRLLKCFPDSSIKGTQTEMEWLKQLLATKEIQATVVR